MQVFFPFIPSVLSAIDIILVSPGDGSKQGSKMQMLDTKMTCNNKGMLIKNPINPVVIGIVKIAAPIVVPVIRSMPPRIEYGFIFSSILAQMIKGMSFKKQIVS